MAFVVNVIIGMWLLNELEKDKSELAQARLSASEIIRVLALVFPGRVGKFRVRRNGAKQWWMVIVIDGEECTVICAAYIMSKGLKPTSRAHAMSASTP